MVSFKKFFILVAFFFGIFFASQTVFAQTPPINFIPTDCHMFTNASNFPFSTPAYSVFGVPYDVYTSPNQLLMDALCVGDSVVMSIGYGNSLHYIWQSGYISRGGGPWTPITFNGSQSDQNWFVGDAGATILSVPDDSYILAYVCFWKEDEHEWKCGCRDQNTCDGTGKWQIQKIQKVQSAG